jgi:transposase-like protein
MQEYVTIIIVLLLGAYAWLTNRKLKNLKHTKLDKTLDNLKRGLKARRKETKDAKTRYHNLRDRRGRFKPSNR